jgi:hypothetical protein
MKNLNDQIVGKVIGECKNDMDDLISNRAWSKVDNKIAMIVWHDSFMNVTDRIIEVLWSS